ncbi:hypothetical protein DFP72DRAFT_908470 [Ephemerocybe angulata]|uniref:F-box domain-containing protein n=1 Tax=Ephemerocybe angulata TaxID=980116 RepID=A0A8H6M3Q8_9AGAR|nr:hypothetical protein DFP72DRAFT_908470 [Tulosesus angulatus]
MNRCLQTPEILQLICEQLPIDRHKDRGRLFAVALSCRALLEPGLDRLWYRIQSFIPLIANLPSDLWNIEYKVASNGPKNTTFSVLGLRRAITSVDLDRFMTYYAQRIREVELYALKSTFSPEAWQALQIATKWEHGALSPFAHTVVWPMTAAAQLGLSKEAVDQAFPYLSLFLGPRASSLHFEFGCDTPIHVASMRSAPNIPSAVKQLELKVNGSHTTAFVCNYLKSFTWENLEVLCVASLSTDAISHISALPRLTTLELREQKKLPNHYRYDWPKDLDEPPAHLAAMSATAFPSLGSLKIFGQPVSVEAFVQQLPANNHLHTLKCTLKSDSGLGVDLESLLITIRLHCHVDRLRKVVIKGIPPTSPVGESIVARFDDGVNLNCIRDFTNLETLDINLPKTTVNLDEHDIVNVSKSFPQLRKLKIDTDVHDSRIPLIDHEDLLNLIYCCAHLKKLGLRFDATRITGEEKAPKKYTKPTALEKLWVGDSPVYWPEGIAKFFQVHCPKLRGQNIILVNLREKFSDTTPIMLYLRRWNMTKDLLHSAAVLAEL